MKKHASIRRPAVLVVEALEGRLLLNSGNLLFIPPPDATGVQEEGQRSLMPDGARANFEKSAVDQLFPAFDKPDRFECGQHYLWWLRQHTSVLGAGLPGIEHMRESLTPPNQGAQVPPRPPGPGAQDKLQERIDNLVQQLGDDDIEIRDKAQAEIEKIVSDADDEETGELVGKALKIASADADPERKARAQAIRQDLHDTSGRDLPEFDEKGHLVRWTTFDSLGQEKDVTEYDSQGAIRKVTFYSWDGKPIRTLDWSGPDPIWIEYGPDGKPINPSGSGKDGRKNQDGSVTTKNRDGSETTTYRDGHKVTIWTDKEGHTTKEESIWPDGYKDLWEKDNQGRITKHETVFADGSKYEAKYDYQADGSHTEAIVRRDKKGRTEYKWDASFDGKNQMLTGSEEFWDWSTGALRRKRKVWNADTRTWGWENYDSDKGQWQKVDSERWKK